MVSSLSGDDLKALAAMPDDERFDDALLGDGRHQLREIAHDLARLIRVRIDQVDRHESTDGHPPGSCQGFDVVLVVPHPN
jgi:hypothetical protein